MRKKEEEESCKRKKQKKPPLKNKIILTLASRPVDVDLEDDGVALLRGKTIVRRQRRRRRGRGGKDFNPFDRRRPRPELEPRDLDLGHPRRALLLEQRVDEFPGGLGSGEAEVGPELGEGGVGEGALFKVGEPSFFAFFFLARERKRVEFRVFVFFFLPSLLAAPKRTTNQEKQQRHSLTWPSLAARPDPEACEPRRRRGPSARRAPRRALALTLSCGARAALRRAAGRRRPRPRRGPGGKF